jgi:hypothetical protein
MEKRGNVGLYERYRASWERIKGSLEAGYYFEAIAIEESIISNRLTSFLHGVGDVSEAEAAGVDAKGKPYFLSFNDLISRWRKRVKQDVTWESRLDLINEVDGWRLQRNKALHALAKSFPGKEPEVGTEEFIAMAKQTAIAGAELARAVSNWHKRQRTRAKKVGLLPISP